ncbi:MAG: CAP domain-containing protein [Acetobacteraceae bacterium]|nr:CAP domain-containing protein [Acetobacteraceae bacterium]
MPPPPGPDPTSLTPAEARLFELINQARAEAGLNPLKINYTLVRLARIKSQDMITNRYFGHVSPTYGRARDMVKAAGLSFKHVGECLAGTSKPDVAHAALMRSPGHRTHILASAYDEVGVGIAYGGPYGGMVTEIFLAR